LARTRATPGLPIFQPSTRRSMWGGFCRPVSHAWDSRHWSGQRCVRRSWL